MKKDLQELPRVRDSISYLYIEKTKIEQDSFAISATMEDGTIHIPIASVLCLMLGPGTTISHAAIKTITGNGCLIVWCGENAGHFYASGQGETRSAKNLLVQAEHCMDKEKHMAVVRKMYEIRFKEVKTKGLSLEQLRGMEGIRVRQSYKIASKQFNVQWKGRDYNVKDWDDSDPINKALSEANSILYSICHAAIVSLGYSTGLGFIHNGKMLSFVYDIADLYKAETTIPAAFKAVSEGGDISHNVRVNCRLFFSSIGILKRIAKDIETLFAINNIDHNCESEIGKLWNDEGLIEGGINYSREEL